MKQRFRSWHQQSGFTQLVALLLLSLLIVGVIISLHLVQSHQNARSLAASTLSPIASPFIASIDTMKESRDQEKYQISFTDAKIANDVNLAATLNPTHITVDTH